MSKKSSAGSLRVAVTILAPVKTVSENGYEETEYRDALGENVWCQWVNAHGTDTLYGLQLGLREPATLTLRYSPLIRPDCRIKRLSDGAIYRIISVDNVRERGMWLELKVDRVVEAV